MTGMWSPGGDFIHVADRSDFLGSGHFWNTSQISSVSFCVDLYRQVCVCICVLKPGANLGYFSSEATHLDFGDRLSPQGWGSVIIQAGWPGSPRHLPACLHVPSAGITSAGQHTWLFLWVLRTEVRSSVFYRKHFNYLSCLLAQDFRFKRSVALQKELQATGAYWEEEKVFPREEQTNWLPSTKWSALKSFL